MISEDTHPENLKRQHPFSHPQVQMHSLCYSVHIVCHEILMLLGWSRQICYTIRNSYDRFHKFGADEKCVSRLHSMDTWESGQLLTMATKWATHNTKLISDGPFASFESYIQLLRPVLSLATSRFVGIMLEGFRLYPQNMFLKSLPNPNFPKDAVCGWVLLIWTPWGHNNGDHDNDGSF